MRVLAFDTSSPTTAVAVVDDGRVLAEDDSATEARHGEVLLPRVVELLARAGLSLRELDLIAVGVGPGSFTGLRVGLAAAKGLALALPLPLRGVDSLAVLACGARDDAGLVLTLLDAFKGELYAAAYLWQEAAPPRCLLPAFHGDPRSTALRLQGVLQGAAQDAVVCGDGARRYRELLQPLLDDGVRFADPARDLPRGRHVAALGAALYAREGASDPAALEPTYVRGSDAQLPVRPPAP